MLAAHAARVLRGLDAIFHMAQSDANFALFGNDIVQCFYDVATVTAEPVRARALMYVEQLAQRWKHSVARLGWKQGASPTPQEVIDAIVGMYCMERVGIGCDVKVAVRRFMDGADGFGAREYLGWEPASASCAGPPPARRGVPRRAASVYRTMSNSLIHTFYAEKVGLTLGCSYADVYKWLDKPSAAADAAAAPAAEGAAAAPPGRGRRRRRRWKPPATPSPPSRRARSGRTARGSGSASASSRTSATS